MDRHHVLGWTILGAAIAAASGCAKNTSTHFVDSTVAADDAGAATGDDDGGTGLLTDGGGGVVVDDGVPSDVVTAFDGADGTGDPPAVYEPRAGTALPSDWRALELLVRAPDAKWIEVTLTVGTTTWRYIGEASQVDHAASDAWRSARLPSTTWSAAATAARTAEAPVAWTVRTLTSAHEAPHGSAKGSLSVVPLAIGTEVTFWEPGAGAGGESAIRRLSEASSTKQTLIKESSKCVGCHATAPDGKDVVFTSSDLGLVVGRPTSSGNFARPSYVSSAAAAAMTALSFPTMSVAAWPSGDDDKTTAHYFAAQTGDGDLAVVNLDAAADVVHTIARTGETRKAEHAAWSPTGGFVAYEAYEGASSDPQFHAGSGAGISADAGTTTGPNLGDGGLPLPPSLDAGLGGTGPLGTSGEHDIHVVDVDLKSGAFGGTPRAVPGAAQAGVLEYYPTVSADGALVAFARATSGTTYANPDGEIWVAPVDGGDAVKLVGHDEPDIEDLAKGRLGNSWPRFSPARGQSGSTGYYAVAFSSQRGPGEASTSLTGTSPAARIFLVIFSRDASGAITPYAPAMIPGQSFDVNDLTPDTRGITSVADAPQVK